MQIVTEIFPEKPGYYWHRFPNCGWEIVKVFDHHGELAARTFSARVFYAGDHGIFGERVHNDNN